MTREEAKYLFNKFEKESTDEVIDKLFDDIESRTCQNCEEFKISKGFNGTEFTCYKGYGNTNMYGYIFTERDFGCNEFKRKR